jgi:hypothetical protein
MPIAETPIASAASEPTTVLFNEALICISSFQAAGRDGVAHIHTSTLKSDVPSIDIEAEQGFFKPKLWRDGPDQRPNRRFHRATAQSPRKKDDWPRSRSRRGGLRGNRRRQRKGPAEAGPFLIAQKLRRASQHTLTRRRPMKLP